MALSQVSVPRRSGCCTAPPLGTRHVPLPKRPCKTNRPGGPTIARRTTGRQVVQTVAEDSSPPAVRAACIARASGAGRGRFHAVLWKTPVELATKCAGGGGVNAGGGAAFVEGRAEADPLAWAAAARAPRRTGGARLGSRSHSAKAALSLVRRRPRLIPLWVLLDEFRSTCASKSIEGHWGSMRRHCRACPLPSPYPAAARDMQALAAEVPVAKAPGADGWTFRHVASWTTHCVRDLIGPCGSH